MPANNNRQRNDFSEIHEIAFGIRDWIYANGKFLPRNVTEAKDTVDELMPDQPPTVRDSIAEVLLALSVKK